MMKTVIENLVIELTQCNDTYYRLGTSTLSDLEYDKKKNLLTTYIKQYPQYENIAKQLLTSVGTTSVSTRFKKEKHNINMLSLDAVYDNNGFTRWVERIRPLVNLGRTEFVVQPKMDGLSIELIYEYGKFIKAITRGDGEYGEDVTENILATNEVPLSFTHFNRYNKVSVVGEVIINTSDFNTYLSDKFKNARNAAVGSLKSLDSSIIPSRYLRVYVYDVFGMYKSSLKEKMKCLNEKFRIVPFSLDTKIDEIEKVFKNMTIFRNGYDFEMDGIVIKVDSDYERKTLGNKTNYPLWAIAWKFNSMTEESIVEYIEWSMSKSGTLTPVAKIKATDIGGVTVTNVNLHNYKFATDTLGLKVGDSVTVRRAGDVIPEIAGVNVDWRNNNVTTNIWPPGTCPYCGDNTKWRGLELYCPNSKNLCTEQNIYKLSHAVAKEALNVDGLSIETLRVLVEKFKVKTVLDLYTFDFSKLNGTAGFGPKKIANIETALNNSKTTDKASFMYAMAIPEVGKSSAIKIIDKMENMSIGKEFYDLTKADISYLNIDGIGQSISGSIEKWNNENKNNNLVTLFNLFTFKSKVKPVKVQSANTGASNPIDNRAVLFTGKLNNMNLTRSQAATIVMKLGGWETTSLSSANILIVGDSPGSKLQKAQGNSKITIITEAQFEKICNDNGV